MSGACSAHRGLCPWDCHINGERKWLLLVADAALTLLKSVETDCTAYHDGEDELYDAFETWGDWKRNHGPTEPNCPDTEGATEK